MNQERRRRVDISVVVPVVERYGDLAALVEEHAVVLDRIGRPYEFVFVVDARQGSALPRLREMQATSRRPIVLVVLEGMFGESTALTLGLEHARGDILVTLASYFQVDPAGLEDAIRKIESGADLVVGRRYPRSDSWFNRLQSGVFHALVRVLTGSRFRDISCGFRVLRREVAEGLTIYGGLHRFYPIVAAHQGFTVQELQLTQRREDLPMRYYGIAVYLKRVLDALTVFFLLRFTRRPLRFFGLLGGIVGGLGVAITGYLGIYRLLGFGGIANRPLLLLGVLLAVLGFQTISIGLIGEIIIFTHAREMPEYRVAEIVQPPDDR